MPNVTRICPQCGHGNAMENRYCAACGADTQASLPAASGANLPAVIGKAALPVLVGAASLALSAGWKLLQGVLSKSSAPVQASRPPAPLQVKTPAPLAPRRARMTVTIRTSWAVGDSNGRWEKGQSEQTIEFGE
jgi:hypothetical protein